MRACSHFILEDTERRKFFRLGLAEGDFVEALLVLGSPRKALDACQIGKPHSMSEQNAIKLCKWLARQGMAVVPEADSLPKVPHPPFSLFGSVFFWKIPLVNPDRWLNSLVSRMGWLFSPHATAAGLAVLVVGLLLMTGHWRDFAPSFQNLFSSWRWLVLAIAWCFLKAVHEIAHGATCRRYGGEVNQAGLAMILLMPIAFVDVTSSWRFASRWQRLHVTLAGVATELFVAGLSLFVWLWSDSLPVKQAAADVFMLASVSSLLFNLNPLLRFDGYFALADVTGVDNLYSYGQSYARYFGGRYILGLRIKPPNLPGNNSGWIKIYGLLAAMYRVVTVTGLLTAAAVLFHGAGIVIATAGAISFIGKPLLKLARHLYQLHQAGEFLLSRFALRLTCLAILGTSLLFVIPAQWDWTAPAIVQYDPPAILRTSSAGFVEQVHATDGEFVSKGQPIVTLRNDDLRIELSKLRKELQLVQQQILSAQWKSDSSALNEARANETSLLEQVQETQLQVDRLVMRAPTDGTLIARSLGKLQGTYLETGAELAVIGNEDQKRLKLSLSQSDAKQSKKWSEQPLRVVVSGKASWNARLTRIETRANLTPPDSALLAVNGGALSTVQNGPDEFVLCEPRVNAYVALTPEQSNRLKSGQRASVSVASKHRSLGDWLLSQIELP